MPIQPECEDCGRLGGYTSDVDTGLCERCIRKQEAEETPKSKSKK